jgi:hypothetical protein
MLMKRSWNAKSAYIRCDPASDSGVSVDGTTMLFRATWWLPDCYLAKAVGQFGQLVIEIADVPIVLPRTASAIL